MNEEPCCISYQTTKQLIRRNIKDPPTQHELTRQVYERYKLTNDEAITNRADQSLIAKIRTGHWKQFREFKSRVDGGKTDPNCRFCPNKLHTMRHWLLDCDATTELRQRIFGNTNIGLDVLALEPVKVVQMARISQF